MPFSRRLVAYFMLVSVAVAAYYYYYYLALNDTLPLPPY
jgi:hypothetical protein